MYAEMNDLVEDIWILVPSSWTTGSSTPRGLDLPSIQSSSKAPSLHFS